MANSKSGPESIINELQEQIKILKHINQENANLIKYDSTDSLTGLLNKDAFFREVKTLFAKFPEDEFLFLRYDIDKFQTINALFGYDEGDRLLQYCATEIQGLKKTIPDSVIGRIDADIFCLCIKFDSTHNFEPTVETTERFLEGFREDYRFNISVGMYVITDTNELMRDIYAKAALAARKCKDNSNLHYFLYDEETDAELVNQQIISSEMHKALKQHEFIMYYQPKVDLKTKKLVGAEALVRWKHPTKGIIPPSDFIPVFYKNGFIASLDLYVFTSVCASLQKWKNAGLNLVPVSINMTQVSMMDTDLPKKLFTIMSTYGIEKEYIHLEITEGSYSVDTEKSINCAKELHEKGIHLEMDDFGTGISSLTMLHELPIDTLKLDLRFIKSYEESKSNAGIIHFIVSLARQMELTLIAEGIETEHQLEFLNNIGCDIGQGYLFSKPVPDIDFQELLQKWETIELAKTEETETLPIDMNDLWVPDSNFNIVFNTIAGPAAIYEITKDATSVKVLKMNDEYLQVMEVEKSGKHHTFEDLLALIQPEDLKELQINLTQVLQTRKPFNMLIRRINILGRDTPKWLRINMRFLFNTKNTTLVLANLEDETAQKEHIDYLEREANIHKDYKKQLSIYRGAETSGLATMKIGEIIELVYANDIFLTMHGCTLEYALEHKNSVLLDTIHPEDKEPVIKALHSVIEKKKDRFSWSMRIKSLNNEVLSTVVNGVVRYEGEDIFADIIVRPFHQAHSVDKQH